MSFLSNLGAVLRGLPPGRRSAVVYRVLRPGRDWGRMTVMIVDHSAPRVLRRRLGRARKTETRPAPAPPLDAITLVLRGEVELREPGRRPRRVREGHYLQVENVVSGPGVFTPSPDCVECSVCLDAPLAARLAELGLWVRRRRHGQAPAPAVLAEHFAALQDQLADPDASEGRVLRTLAELVEGFRAPRSAEPRRKSVSWRDQACALLDSITPSEGGIAHIAQRAGMSFSTFRRRFRAETGLSPGRYQRHVRFRRARELLRQHSVKEVAALLGYADPFVFSRGFRRVWGCPPSAFRP